MTSYMIDLTWSGQFHIITHPEINFWLIIYHLTYLTFLVNLPNQHFKSSFWINLSNQTSQSIYIKLAALLAFDTLLPQTYILREVYFYLLTYIWFK